MIKRNTRLATVLSVAALLTGCVAGQSGVKPTTKLTADDAKGGFLAAGEMVKTDVSTGAAFNGANKVLIASFKVGFVESKRASVQAGGGLTGSAFGGKSTALMKMEGLSATTMQKVTDSAYQQFKEKLTAQGYTLVDHSQLFNQPKFEQVKRYDMPLKVDNSGLLSDYGVSYYFSPKPLGTSTPIYMGEIPGEMGGIGWSGPNAYTSEFAAESGVRVINLAYVIDFAYTDSYGGWHTNSSSISVGQLMSVVPGAQLTIIGGHGGTFSKAIGSIRTEEGLVSEADIGTLADTTSETNKAVQMATNVIGILGGIGSNSSREYTLKVNEAKFQNQATLLAEKMNNNFINKMVQLR
ncbi:hypothetical protein [uncultured Amphritea sp.]|uniref:hypothetical protein n=1 Tax=uncultured Amphritea sp. TaxID=981605 RepID=UPI0026024BA0|nr:hypothetical protein [uncultured Amphritea sp.]